MKLIAVCGMAFAACTSVQIDEPDVSPGVGNSPGFGTGTLFVDAHVDATPVVMNTNDTALFDVNFRVLVTSTVGGDWAGAVTITSTSGPHALAFDGSAWVGTISGYDEVYQLDVDGDVDFLRGVRVDGPVVHHITSPAPGGEVQDEVGTIAWERATPSAQVVLTGRDPGDIADYPQPDLGYARFDPYFRYPDGYDNVTVTRLNSITPNGAGEKSGQSSQLSVSIANTIPVVAVF